MSKGHALTCKQYPGGSQDLKCTYVGNLDVVIAQKRDVLQCNVASEGSGVEDEVVRRELAPFSSSVPMFREQKGTNLARVFSGFALATHSASR